MKCVYYVLDFGEIKPVKLELTEEEVEFINNKRFLEDFLEW